MREFTAIPAVHGALFINSYKVETNVQRKVSFTSAQHCQEGTEGGGSRIPCVASWGLCSLICKWGNLRHGFLWRVGG